MLIGEPRVPGKVPERNDIEYDSFKSTFAKTKEDLPDFDMLLQGSNYERQLELAKEQEAMGGGELHIGETKDAKQFREQLEKITGRKQDKLKNKMDKDDYLNLMVTQLKYQDPSKPMESTEMATQLAQFNSVEQLVSINKALTDMNKISSESRADKLTQYLGKQVEVSGHKIKLTGSGVVNQCYLDIPTECSNVTVEIKDATGKPVRNIPLGHLSEGHHNFSWDGCDNIGMKVAKGEYQFAIRANSPDGKVVQAKTSYSVTIDGISSIATGGQFETAFGAIDLNKIIAVRTPKEAHTTAAENQEENTEGTKNVTTESAKQTQSTTVSQQGTNGGAENTKQMPSTVPSTVSQQVTNSGSENTKQQQNATASQQGINNVTAESAKQQQSSVAPTISQQGTNNVTAESAKQTQSPTTVNATNNKSIQSI